MGPPPICPKVRFTTLSIQMSYSSFPNLGRGHQQHPGVPQADLGITLNFFSLPLKSGIRSCQFYLLLITHPFLLYILPS